MGKPNVAANGSHDGHQLLVNVSGTESEVEQFSLPPLRKGPRSNLKTKKTTNSSSCAGECRGFLRVAFILILIAMIGAVGVLGYLVLTLKQDVSDLQIRCSTGIDAASKKWEGTGRDVKALEAKEKRDVNRLYANIVKVKKELIAMNFTLAGLKEDAVALNAVSMTVQQVKQLNADLNEMKINAASTKSNFEGVEGDVDGAKKDIAVLQGKVNAMSTKAEEMSTGLDGAKTTLGKAASRLDDLDKSVTALDERTSSLATVNVSRLHLTTTKLFSQVVHMKENMSALLSSFTLLSGALPSPQLQSPQQQQQQVNATAAMVKQLSQITKAISIVTHGIKGLYTQMATMNEENKRVQERISVVASQVASLNSSVVLLQANYVSALLHGQNLSSLLEGLSASGGGDVDAAMSQALHALNISSLISSVVDRVMDPSSFEWLHSVQQMLEAQNASLSALANQVAHIAQIVYNKLLAEEKEKGHQVDEVIPTEDQPTLPTEIRHHQKQLTATENMNKTTTEAATDDKPKGLVTETQLKTSETTSTEFPTLATKGTISPNASSTQVPTTATAAVAIVTTPEEDVSPSPMESTDAIVVVVEGTERAGNSTPSPNVSTESSQKISTTEAIMHGGESETTQSLDDEALETFFSETDNAEMKAPTNAPTVSGTENGSSTVEVEVTTTPTTPEATPEAMESFFDIEGTKSTVSDQVMTTSSSDLREEESENSSASPTIVVESEESFADDLADLDSDVEDEEEPSNETKPADDVQPDQLMISIAKGMKSVFDSLDTDDSGDLRYSEITQELANQTGFGDDKAFGLFSSLDLNNDGKIELSELDDFLESKGALNDDEDEEENSPPA
ncbi:serine-rich adhesin for platelets-like [Oscarella lobularis]|uniref:serine-rich adhesin for platelets-like n=1 Tax=Oscarella lobularis TaxID=121494 RepID=UPI003313DB50